jgi:hypothetical protein
MVGVKRVVDYAVKVRIAADKKGVDLANVKVRSSFVVCFCYSDLSLDLFVVRTTNLPFSPHWPSMTK